jgi:hypothetical protein
VSLPEPHQKAISKFFMMPSLSRLLIGPTAMLIALCSSSPAIAADAATAAQVPPSCTDAAVLKRVAKEYNGLEEMGERSS